MSIIRPCGSLARSTKTADTHLWTMPPCSLSSTLNAERVLHSSKLSNSSSTPNSREIVLAASKGAHISTTGRARCDN